MKIEVKIKQIEEFVNHSTRWQEEGEYTAKVFVLLKSALKIIKKIKHTMAIDNILLNNQTGQANDFFEAIKVLEKENAELKAKLARVDDVEGLQNVINEKGFYYNNDDVLTAKAIQAYINGGEGGKDKNLG
jgi:hypothetical protein